MLPTNFKLSTDLKTPYLAWRLLSIVLVGGMLAIIFVSTYFIYTTIYQTLEDANSIVILNSSVDLSTINGPIYNKAHDLVALKNTTSTSTKNLRNIFIPLTTPSSSTR